MTAWTDRVFRLATVLGSIVTLVMLAISVPVVLATRSPESGEALVWPIPFGAMALVGAFMANRRPRISTGWLFLGAGLVMVSNAFAQDYALYASERSLPARDLAAWLGSWTWMPATVLIALVLIVFPDGRARTRFWRWVARIGVLLIPVTAAAAIPMLGQSASVILAAPTHSSIPGGAGLAALGEGPLPAFIPLAFVALVVRFVRSRGIERQQMKWFVFGASLVAASTLIMFLVSVLFGVEDPISDPLAGAALGLGMTALPVTAAVAVLRHRLYDIDLVIRKTVVVGALAGFITVVYVGVVVGIGSLVGRGDEPNLGLSILATALVAVAFQPVRERIHRLADRLVYGRRATPYEVLTEFSGRMAEAYAMDDVLARMAQILGAGTGATRSEVWLRVGEELRLAASWPEPRGKPAVPISGEALPALPEGNATEVRHRGELLGALVVAMPPNDPMNPAKATLVQDLAAQAGLVLRNVRLIEELRASRQRLVAAQDEERRRIERNLHDGAQQQLVALAVKLRLAQQLTRRDAERAAEMLEQLRSETQDALENLRDLARGIYPPLLADQGLVAALETQARKSAVPVVVEAEGEVGRYPQEVEAAVYFCVLEALQNVAKYAEATAATVRLSATNGDLRFEVADDGRGFDPATARGTGLQGMADRLDALGGTLQVRSEPGGGTRVGGRIPAGRFGG